jgi:hypothetical protein
LPAAGLTRNQSNQLNWRLTSDGAALTRLIAGITPPGNREVHVSAIDEQPPIAVTRADDSVSTRERRLVISRRVAVAAWAAVVVYRTVDSGLRSIASCCSYTSAPDCSPPASVKAADAPVICETADDGRKDDIAFLRDNV